LAAAPDSLFPATAQSSERRLSPWPGQSNPYMMSSESQHISQALSPALRHSFSSTSTASIRISALRGRNGGLHQTVGQFQLMAEPFSQPPQLLLSDVGAHPCQRGTTGCGQAWHELRQSDPRTPVVDHLNCFISGVANAASNSSRASACLPARIMLHHANNSPAEGNL
jgi:hypothetical protein